MVQAQPDPREIYKQGLDLISGDGKEPTAAEFEIGRDKIAQASAAFPPALAHLAALDALHIGGNSSDAQTASTYLRAAMSGFPPAVRGLGCILLSSAASEGFGAGLLRRAAQSGDWVAAFLILREALRGRRLANPAELNQLAQHLSPAVPFQADLIAGLDILLPGQEVLKPAPFKQAICENALRQALATERENYSETLCAVPWVRSIAGVLSPLECDYLIAVSSPLMQPSKVVDADASGSFEAGYRTSDGAVLLPVNMDLVAVILSRKLAGAAGVAPEQGEFLSLLRYVPGQEYRPHHDFLEPDNDDYSRVKSCGQRQRTLLTYLNSSYNGGETAFPELTINFKGKPGDGLCFDNVDASSAPIQTSLHAGMPVTSGEKWLATLWCRERPFWPWMRQS